MASLIGIKEAVTSGSCSMHRKDEKYVQSFGRKT
jgi:hypothetical protein